MYVCVCRCICTYCIHFFTRIKLWRLKQQQLNIPNGGSDCGFQVTVVQSHNGFKEGPRSPGKSNPVNHFFLPTRHKWLVMTRSRSSSHQLLKGEGKLSLWPQVCPWHSTLVPFASWAQRHLESDPWTKHLSDGLARLQGLQSSFRKGWGRSFAKSFLQVK